MALNDYADNYTRAVWQEAFKLRQEHYRSLGMDYGDATACAVQDADHAADIYYKQGRRVY